MDQNQEGAPVPHGWVLVPAWPTPEMLNALCKPASQGDVVQGYQAMLKAAPQPPQGEEHARKMD